jgi:hypothetical protein
MTEMSAMEMPCGRAMRMSPRASGRMAEPSAEAPAPAARPGTRRRGGSRVDAMPALCTARRKIAFRMSWRFILIYVYGCKYTNLGSPESPVLWSYHSPTTRLCRVHASPTRGHFRYRTVKRSQYQTPEVARPNAHVLHKIYTAVQQFKYIMPQCK